MANVPARSRKNVRPPSKEDVTPNENTSHKVKATPDHSSLTDRQTSLKVKKLRLNLRFSRGHALNRWREAGPIDEEHAPELRLDSQSPKLPNAPGAEKTESITRDVIKNFPSLSDETKYNSDVLSLNDVIRKFVASLAAGEDFSVSAAEMPATDIPPEACARLVQQWTDDITRIRDGVAGDQAPQAASPVEEQPEVDVATTPVSIPKSLTEVEAVVPGVVAWKDAGLRLYELPQFIRRYYSTWVGQGLDRTNIRLIDPSLERAIQNYQRKGRRLPNDCYIPTVKDQTDLLIANAKVSLGATDKETLQKLAKAVATSARRRDRG